jgi:hypothetical protein
MATLSNVKSNLVTVGKWAAVILGILLVIFVLIKIFSIIKNTISPNSGPPPSVSFGKLPVTYYPSGIKRDFSYTVDTISGSLPTFPDRYAVYKMLRPDPQLLAFKDASQKVTQLGFDPNPEKLSDSVYRWRQTDLATKVLVLDINRSQFGLSSNFLKDPNVTTANNLPGKEQAIETAKDFLNILGVYPSDVDEGKTKAQLLRINNGIIVAATNPSTADLVSVYFYQKNVNKTPLVYPGGKISSMNVTVAGGKEGGQVVDARFAYQAVGAESSTYPIKTAEQALTELKSGKGYIANVDPGLDKISLKKVYIAYFFPGRQQYFLTPVIVFEGTNNFMAYVPAVKDEWFDK